MVKTYSLNQLFNEKENDKMRIDTQHEIIIDASFFEKFININFIR